MRRRSSRYRSVALVAAGFALLAAVLVSAQSATRSATGGDVPSPFVYPQVPDTIRFSHAAHDDTSCASCHAAALTSRRSRDAGFGSEGRNTSTQANQQAINVKRQKGEQPSLRSRLLRALALSEPEGYRRVYLDEGWRLADLLRQCREHVQIVQVFDASRNQKTLVLQGFSGTAGTGPQVGLPTW